MDLPTILQHLIKDYKQVKTFEINVTSPINSEVTTLSILGKARSVRVVGKIQQGKANILQEGLNNFFLYQNTSQISSNNRVINENNYKEVLQLGGFPPENILFIILSEPIPLNYLDRTNLELTTEEIIEKPYLQYVEDIIIKGSIFSAIPKKKLVTTDKEEDVKNIFNTFYKFLRKEGEKESTYNSFYNYMLDTRRREETISKALIVLDTEEEIKRKIKVLNSIFPNNNLLKLPFKIVMGYRLTKEEETNTTNPFIPIEEPQFISSLNPYQPKDQILYFKSDYLDKKIYLVVLSNLMLATKPFPIVSQP